MASLSTIRETYKAACNHPNKEVDHKDSLPPFEYGDAIYGNSSTTVLNRMPVLQNIGVRILLDYNYITHIVDLFSELKWFNIKDRLKFP